MPENRAYEQAASQMSGIADMVAALEYDYDRLQELKDERQALVDTLESATAEAAEQDDNAARELQTVIDVAARELASWDIENGEELDELSTAAGDCESRDDAEQRVHEDPLSVEVRSDWAQPGDDMTPGEFRILLCTGGPAVQIRGELDDYRQPRRAWLEYQDWGTPWTQYIGENLDAAALLTYCQQFYFGE